MVVTMIVAFLISVLSGLGVGGGSLLVIYLSVFTDTPQLTAQGINLLFFLFSAGSSILIHIQKRQIFPMVILVLAATGIVGSLGGFALAARMEEGFLRKIFGVMLLSSFASSAMVCFIVSFIRTMASYTTVSIILGTLIGFLVGAYIPIGQLPAGVQNVIRYFPCAHSAALFRQLMMDGLSDVSFAALPAAQRAGFEETLGVRFTYGSTVAPAWVSIAILVGTGVVFYLLAILNMSRKRKK